MLSVARDANVTAMSPRAAHNDAFCALTISNIMSYDENKRPLSIVDKAWWSSGLVGWFIG